LKEVNKSDDQFNMLKATISQREKELIDLKARLNENE
jgi:hypothetical protein